MRTTHRSHGISESVLVRELSIQLIVDRVKHRLDIFYALEFRVVLVCRIQKVLDFSHGELSHSDEARAGRDLVSEGVADLGAGKGQSTLVELQQALEIDKDALGRLWAEVALESASGANRRAEHQVELHGVCQRIACCGRLHVVLADSLGHFRHVHTLHLR